MTSPVMLAIVNAKSQEQDQYERTVAAAVAARLDLPAMPSDKSAWPIFAEWCQQKALTAFPARPGTVAFFILENILLGIDALLKIVEAVSTVHRDLADPTLSPMVSAALNTVAPITPPRSWPAPQKLTFISLPRTLQSYVVQREDQREKEVRRAQNEAADARKALAAIQTPKADNGIQSNTAAQRRAG